MNKFQFAHLTGVNGIINKIYETFKGNIELLTDLRIRIRSLLYKHIKLI